jgi:hypothetical protein
MECFTYDIILELETFHAGFSVLTEQNYVNDDNEMRNWLVGSVKFTMSELGRLAGLGQHGWTY